MKKILLSLLVAGGFAASSFAQFEFYVQGDASGTDYSGGGTYEFQATGDTDQYTKVDIINKTGAEGQYVIGRRRITPTAGDWTDYMCWDLCIDAQFMTSDYFQMQGNAVTLADNATGLLESHIQPNYNNTGSYTYRYYIGTTTDYFMDSMDLRVVLTEASVPEPTLTVGVAPNPASDYVTIDVNGFESANVQVVDVLGNTVMTSKINGSTTIDVAEFRNGIYFVTVSAEGRRVSRKVMIRH